jgi:pimeloyl-ACP methyl ester carboxylesterase
MSNVSIIRPVPKKRLRVALAIAMAVMLASLPGVAAARAAKPASVKPTIVLVHGAFADASSWAPVISRLQAQGYPVIAPANPLRGVAYDASYLGDVLKTISGPIVLVGHSYGGFVITNAATGNPNVKALVYIAAYAPEEGETIAGIEQLAPGGMIGPETLDIENYPLPGGGEAPEATIKPALFHQIFDADLPLPGSNELAAAQRPAALSTLEEPSGPPAWKTIPSWYLIPGEDHAIGTAVERIMAKRIHAKTVEVKSASHLVMLSHPGAATKLILEAAARA